MEFWLPQQQSELRRLGDLYRTAMRNGDSARALKFAPYADFDDVDDVRAQFSREGLEILGSVGAVELLGRRAS